MILHFFCFLLRCCSFIFWSSPDGEGRQTHFMFFLDGRVYIMSTYFCQALRREGFGIEFGCAPRAAAWEE